MTIDRPRPPSLLQAISLLPLGAVAAVKEEAEGVAFVCTPACRASERACTRASERARLQICSYLGITEVLVKAIQTELSHYAACNMQQHLSR